MRINIKSFIIYMTLQSYNYIMIEQVQGYKIIKVISQTPLKNLSLVKYTPKDKIFFVKSYKKSQLSGRYLYEQFLNDYERNHLPITNKQVARVRQINKTDFSYEFVCDYFKDGNLLELQIKRPNKVWSLLETLEIVGPLLQALIKNDKKGAKQIFTLHPKQIFVHKINEQKKTLIIDGDEPFLKNYEFYLREPTCLGFMKIDPLDDIKPVLQNQPPEAWGTMFKDYEKYHVWKIGLLFYFLLNAQYPFQSDTVQELQRKSKDFSYCYSIKKTTRRRYEYCTLQLQQLFNKIFNPDPKQRMTYEQIIFHPLFSDNNRSSVSYYESIYQDNQKVQEIRRKFEEVAFLLTSLDGIKNLQNIIPPAIFLPMKYNILIYASNLFNKATNDYDFQKLKFDYLDEKLELPQQKKDIKTMNEKKILEDYGFLFTKFTERILKPINTQLQKVMEECSQILPQIQENNNFFEFFILRAQKNEYFQKSYEISVNNCYQFVSEKWKERIEEDEKIFSYCSVLMAIYMSFPELIRPKKKVKKLLVDCFGQQQEDIENLGMEFFYLYIQNLSKKKEKRDIINYLFKNIIIFGR